MLPPSRLHAVVLSIFGQRSVPKAALSNCGHATFLSLLDGHTALAFRLTTGSDRLLRGRESPGAQRAARVCR